MEVSSPPHRRPNQTTIVMSRNLTALSARKGLSCNLFERLGELSEKEGAPTPEELRQLAGEFLMGPANLYGTASFYDFTRPENKGKKVYVCNGTACRMAGTQEALKSQLSQHFQKEEIGEMCCLGRCHENAAFQYQGRNYSGNAIGQLEAIREESIQNGEGRYTVQALGRPVLTEVMPTLEGCRYAVGQMLKGRPEDVMAAVELSRLRGRGGAGFPLAVKMQACREAYAGQKFVVCNADEGDPGSYSDRYLLEQRPITVLLGMLISGYAIGAETGVLYIRAEYPESVTVIEQAIDTLRSAGLAGKDIMDSGFSFDFKIIKARGAYICGEETALLASIEGQRPEVRARPPFPAQEGLFGKPTLVSNVETLANLFFILEKGGEAYAATGTGKSTGTKLLSLDGAFRRPGVYEVPMGTPLQTVVDELGGGFRKPVKALHIGGPLGGLVPALKIPSLTIDFESFHQEGFLLGHASVVSVPVSYPMIEYLEHIFAFTAHESCGKCFPCRLGSKRGEEMLHKAQSEGYRIDRRLFEDLLETLEKGSLCGLGGGMPLPVRNALQYFAEELKPYFAEQKIAIQ
ncbi:MAG: NAD(P)H-dependent oxidoreductase subunit E [Phaeodactylibacter sp.]|nr:NAD(P)H-dependent oxidoreductase subunit E [Phaeodactylibacter sp.]